MKRKWHHPEAPDTGKRYFRGVGELQDTPQFREWLGREFPQGAAEMNDPEEASVSRRNFIRLMGASTALAGFGMAGCRRPEAYLVPYTKAVEWVIPGKPLLYATAMPRAFGSTPLVAVTHEGARPTSKTTRSIRRAAALTSKPKPRSSTSTTRSAPAISSRTAKKSAAPSSTPLWRS
ncbi:MAG: TAT-variant-translocated molybdopterin oxidoreductase [Verrucomicrobiales bacterium]